MADPRFFTSAGPFSLADLTKSLGLDGYDADTMIDGLASLSEAGPSHISFLSNPKLAAQLTDCHAAAVLVKAENKADCPTGMTPIVCDDPYAAMARVAQKFYPDAAQSRPPRDVLEQAGKAVHPSAKIGENVSIAPNAVIGPNAEIGDGSSIGAGAVIGHGVVLGRDCTVGANAAVSYALLGDRVIVQAGAIVGCDGFGFAPGAAHIKIPQLGRVILQADVEIGGNAAIDRGALGDTVIGEGSKLDNLVHIAHNVQVGRHCFITASCAIAGSTVLGDYVQMGGGSKITGHVEIGDHCVVSAMSAVLRSFPANSQIAGNPGRLRSELYRDQAFISRLRKKDK